MMINKNDNNTLKPILALHKQDTNLFLFSCVALPLAALPMSVLLRHPARCDPTVPSQWFGTRRRRSLARTYVDNHPGQATCRVSFGIRLRALVCEDGEGEQRRGRVWGTGERGGREERIEMSR